MLGCYFWYTHWHQARVASQQQIGVERTLLACVLLIHGYAIFSDILQSDHLYFGTAEALSTTVWIAITSYWLATFAIRLDGLQPVLFFIATLLMGFNLILPAEHHRIAVAVTPLFKLHFILAMLAYGLMLYAVWLALLIKIADRQLHIARGKYLVQQLPSLLTLEKYLFDSIAIGFVLLTLALMTGFGFAFREYGLAHAAYFSHKVIFALLSWLVFAVLLWGRIRRGWRGRFAVNWILVGFILLILSYIGSSFVLHILLQRDVS